MTLRSPELGRKEVAIKWSKVVLPEPDDPMIAIDSPGAARTLIFLSPSCSKTWLKLTLSSENAKLLT